MVRTVILVPRREDPWRDKVWCWVRQWWRAQQPDWTIYEGIHGSEEGPFNRAAALNRAAELAGSWDCAVILDADTIQPSPIPVKQASLLALEQNRLVLPHDTRWDFTRESTVKLMEGCTPIGATLTRMRTFANMSSAVVCCSRRLWDKVGGFDEKFSGWGFEDTAFATACASLEGKLMVRLPYTIWHLWHPQSPELDFKSATYLANQKRCSLYTVGDKSEIQKLCRGEI